MSDYGHKFARLEIHHCLVHGFWAISIADERTDSGTRVTTHKGCGRWETVTSFALTSDWWRELGELAEGIASDMELER